MVGPTLYVLRRSSNVVLTSWSCDGLILNVLYARRLAETTAYVKVETYILHIHTPKPTISTSLIIELRSKHNDHEVPLQLSVRFREDAIVRNSLLSGKWGIGERSARTSRIPISAGERFTVRIAVGNDRFHITINNQQFCAYAFRTAVHVITSVALRRDLQTITQVDHRSTFPTMWPPVQMDDDDVQLNRSTFDFSSDVPQPFSACDVTLITAVALSNQTRGGFVVFVTGGGRNKFALHLKVNFNPNMIVMSSNGDEDNVE